MSDLLSFDGAEVELIDCPWSQGRKIRSSYGPVEVQRYVPNYPSTSRAVRVAVSIDDAIEQMRSIAAARGANAVACPMLEVDPFGKDIVIRLAGMALDVAKPLWWMGLGG